jgi:hypothetical protein
LHEVLGIALEFFVVHDKKPGARLDKVQDTRVDVVGNVRTINAFPFILFLNRTKVAFSKLLLKLLVGVVDAQLLESVAPVVGKDSKPTISWHINIVAYAQTISPRKASGLYSIPGKFVIE